MNMVMASSAISPSVRAAVCAAGALNAGTPSDTASTPVIAVQPLANAESSTNRVIEPAPKVVQRVGGHHRHGGARQRLVGTPATISASITPTNA